MRPDRYLEFRVLPDPEFSAPHLMNALFAKLHRTLVDLRSSDIGLAFPQTGQPKPGLGDRLRLFGSEAGLRQLMSGEWLQGMRDHVDHSGVMMVPEGATWQTVRRIQFLGASDLRRLRKRLMLRTGCSEAEACKQVPDTAAEQTRLPYLTVRSASSGQTFRLFLKQAQAKAYVEGEFNSYGLSSTATVPAFS